MFKTNTGKFNSVKEGRGRVVLGWGTGRDSQLAMRHGQEAGSEDHDNKRQWGSSLYGI